MAIPTLASLTAQIEEARAPALDLAILQRYMGMSRPACGVKTAELRRFARDANRALPAGDEGDAAWHALLDDLYAGQYFDQRLLAGHLLHARSAARKALDLERLRGWVRPMQGWCEVDTTCQSGWSAAEVLARWEIWERFLVSLANEGSLALRRASLVLLLQPLRESSDERLKERAFATAALHADERDTLITKAVSWLLRGMLVHHSEAVAVWLEEHAGRLPAVALRETRNKLATGRK